MILLAFRNFLRQLYRQSIFSTINLLGLATGMACFVLIGLYATDELSYENFYKRADRIYRISPPDYARTAPLLAPRLSADLPEIEYAARLARWGGVMKYETESYYERELCLTTPNLLRMLNFEYLSGSAKAALDQPGSILITASVAEKYFGTTEVLGKELIFLDTIPLTVSAVIQDLPEQTHLPFNMIASWTTFDRYMQQLNLETWSENVYYTYVQLRPGTDPGQFQQKLNRFTERHINTLPNREDYRLTAQNFKAIHLHSDKDMEWVSTGDVQYLYIFSTIAFVVLLIALINFVNLSTAIASQRSREVGIRKTLGARYSQLIGLFLSESMLSSMLALLMAVVMVVLVLPLLNQVAGKSIDSSVLLQPLSITYMVGFALLTGLLAGIYPSLILSAFRPIAVLKGKAGAGPRLPLLRKGLVSLQFAISFILLTGAGVIFKQIQFMQNQELGFDEEQVLVLPFFWDGSVQQQYPALRSSLENISAVQSVTASGDIPGRMSTTMGFWAEGMPENKRDYITTLYTDRGFMDTYGIKLLAGRSFRKDQPVEEEAEKGYLLNKQAAQALGWTVEEAIGKRFSIETEGRIIGVMENFHFNGLQEAVQPLVIGLRPEWNGYISLRLNTNAPVEATLSSVEQNWNRLLPHRPFQYFFLDRDFRQQYLAEIRLSRVTGSFAALAVFIAAIGLFGLALFMTRARTKEIAVRKVLGASVSNLILLLIRSFSQPLVWAFCIAAPFSWWLLKHWLSHYAYRIELEAEIFLLSTLLITGIALLSVTYQILQAVRVNPAEWLREE